MKSTQPIWIRRWVKHWTSTHRRWRDLIVNVPINNSVIPVSPHILSCKCESCRAFRFVFPPNDIHSIGFQYFSFPVIMHSCTMTEAALFHPRLPSTIICGTLDLFQRKPFGKDWHCSRSGTTHSISRNGHFYLCWLRQRNTYPALTWCRNRYKSTVAL